MMSDGPVDSTHWDAANGKYLRHAASQGAMETGVAKSEQEMEATARELYSVLGVKDGFVPQSEVGRYHTRRPVNVSSYLSGKGVVSGFMHYVDRLFDTRQLRIL